MTKNLLSLIRKASNDIVYRLSSFIYERTRIGFHQTDIVQGSDCTAIRWEHSKEMDEADVTEEIGREWMRFWDLSPQSSKAFREAYNPPYIVS